jgi:hypothetical protein
LPAQGSHRSVRAHISAYGSSNSGFAACCITHPIVAIRLCFVDTLSRARCLRRISQRRFHYSTPRFPPSGRPGRPSPSSQVLSRRSDFLPFVPRRFVAFARRYHGSTRLVSFLPTPSRAERRAWGFGYRFPRAIFSDMETTGSLKSPGDLDCLFAHVPGLRQVETTLANNTSFARPPLPSRRRHPRIVLFRSSIARLLDSLSTLRSDGHPPPRKTRF